MSAIGQPLMLLALTSGMCTPSMAAMKSPWEVIGQGNKQCSEWTADKTQAGQAYALDAAWITGVLSGYNGGQGGDVTASQPIPQMIGYIDTYCAAKPNQTVSGAVRALIDELEIRVGQP